MPNMQDDAVAEWLAEREPDLGILPSVPVSPHLADLVVRLGQALDVSQAADPKRLGALLKSAPLRDKVRLILGQLDAPSRLRLLDWFGSRPMPDPHSVVDTYLGDSPAYNGRQFREELFTLHRNAVLNRIFRHDRITGLFEACRTAGQAEEMA